VLAFSFRSLSGHTLNECRSLLRGKRAVDAPRLDVSRAFGEPGINNASLFGCVLVPRSGEFRKNCDDAPGCPYLKLLPTLKTRTAQRRLWNDDRRLIFDSDGHDSVVVSRAGIEPATTALKVRCSTN
jgi:hypothetical protein